MKLKKGKKMEISKADLNFIKSYHKDKKSYNEVSTLNSNNFDCNERQAPLRVFHKVKRKDYSRCKHFSKIRRTLSRDKADELILQVDELNDYTKTKLS